MNNPQEPIFIVGTPRSGTTLLRLIIDSHTDVAITPESSFLFRVLSIWKDLFPHLNNTVVVQSFIDELRKLPQVKDWVPKECNAEVLLQGKEAFDTLSDFIDAFFGYYSKSKGKERWGDKTPKNLYAIDQILELFPSAKIVIVVRDCRDVAMSLNNAEFSGVSYISGSLRWQSDADVTKKIMQKYGNQIYLLKYENLLEDPDETIQQLLKYLNLSADPGIMKRYTEHDDDVVHTKSSLYMKPVSKENLYKWKKEMSQSCIEECEAIAKKGLEYFDYEVVTENPSISKVKVLVQKIIGFIQLVGNSKNMENYYVYGRLRIRHLFNK